MKTQNRSQGIKELIQKTSIMNDYRKILSEIKLLRGEISSVDITAHTVDGWLPRKYVMKFLDFGDTTMNTLEKSGKLIVSKVGSRKFYTLKSVQDLLIANKKSI